MSAAAITGGGMGLSALGNIYAGDQNAKISDYNATIADQNADTVIGQSAEEARRSRQASSKAIGSAEAAYGASGVTSDGSAQWVLRNSAAQGELNALTIRHKGAVQANAYRNEAALDRFRSGNDKVAGYFGAGGSLLSGASRLSSMGSSSGTATASQQLSSGEDPGL